MRQKLFMTLLLIMSLAFATTTFTACGDDGDGDVGGSAGAANLDGAVDGADGSTEAGSLNAEQAQDVCTALNSYIQSAISEQEIKQFSCTFAGAFAAAFAGGEGDAAVMACEEARDMCLAEPFDRTEEDCSTFTFSESCTATLDEMEACISEQATAIKQLAATLTCSNALSENDSGLAGIESGAACQVIEQKCPEFLESEDDGGGSGGDCTANPGPDCCAFANDGACDEPTFCEEGTDTTDCSQG